MMIVYQKKNLKNYSIANNKKNFFTKLFFNVCPKIFGHTSKKSFAHVCTHIVEMVVSDFIKSLNLKYFKTSSTLIILIEILL